MRVAESIADRPAKMNGPFVRLDIRRQYCATEKNVCQPEDRLAWWLLAEKVNRRSKSSICEYGSLKNRSLYRIIPVTRRSRGEIARDA